MKNGAPVEMRILTTWFGARLSTPRPLSYQYSTCLIENNQLQKVQCIFAGQKRWLPLKDRLATICISPAVWRASRDSMREFCVFGLRILGEIPAQIDVAIQMSPKSRLLGNSEFTPGLQELPPTKVQSNLIRRPSSRRQS